jgi:hypothetical protein
MSAKALPVCVKLPQGYSPDEQFWANCDSTLIRTIAKQYAECWSFDWCWEKQEKRRKLWTEIPRFLLPDDD